MLHPDFFTSDNMLEMVVYLESTQLLQKTQKFMLLFITSVRITCFESFVSGLLNDERIKHRRWRYPCYACGFIIRLGILYAGSIGLARSIESNVHNTSDIVKQVILHIYLPGFVILIFTEMGNQTSLNRQKWEREEKEKKDRILADQRHHQIIAAISYSSGISNNQIDTIVSDFKQNLFEEHKQMIIGQINNVVIDYTRNLDVMERFEPLDHLSERERRQ